MHTEEIKQAVQLFDTVEKWKAFLALTAQTNELRNVMHRTAYDSIKAYYFASNHNASGWSYMPITPNELFMVWYLTEYKENSICIVMGWSGEIYLEARGGEFYNDVAKATLLLKSEKFNALLTKFQYVGTENDKKYLASEKFNFGFGTTDDGNFDSMRLAWYAHFKTKEFLQQIIEKVSRFQTPEMTALLAEFNRETRVINQ